MSKPRGGRDTRRGGAGQAARPWRAAGLRGGAGTVFRREGGLLIGGSRFMIQFRVLFALVMREMTTRFGKSSGGYLWAVVEPVGMIALLSFVFLQIARTPPLGQSFPLFFATGFLVFQTWREIASNIGAAIRGNRPLLAFPRVTLIDTLLARFLLQLITSLFVGAVVLGGLIAYDGDNVALDVAPILTSIAFTALLGLGIGTLNAVLFIFFSIYERIYGIITRPLFLISGVFFTYENMPFNVQNVIWWNPLIHLTGYFRTGIYPIYEADYVSLIYVLVFALAPLFIGLLLLRALKTGILER